MSILSFGYSILLRCVSARKLPPYSFLSKVCCEGVGEVLFAYVRLKAHQILRYYWNMQNVIDEALIALFVEWDIADMLNGVNCVIPSFHIAGSFVFL